MEGLVGFEPTLRELQSRALPLGYRPIIFSNTLILYTFSKKVSIKFKRKIKFNMNNNTRLKELQIDEIIWIIFITISIINIIGDEFEKKYCTTKDLTSLNKSKNIFTFTLFASLLIYSYILYTRYQKYKNNTNNNLNKERLFASILVVIATIINLYCQLKDRQPTNPTIL